MIKVFRLVCVLSCLTLVTSCGEKTIDNTYLDYAIKTANWLEAQKVVKEEGAFWRSSDETEFPAIYNTGLYNGSAGVVLFYLELHHQTGDEKYLKEAVSGADYMLAALPDSLTPNFPLGLYIGSSGVGFTLAEVYKATKDDKYLKGVETCVELLNQAKVQDESGINWGPNTDIISGNTGMGMFLLYAHQEFGIGQALPLASGVGRGLINMARDTIGGKKWMMLPEYPRYMPNFSHGTAGTAYFLATLYEETNDPQFKEAALTGAEHLLSIANDDGLIYHHDPDTTGLMYYGWCHGPTGTGRLYHKLSKIEQDTKWNMALTVSSKAMLDANLVEEHPDGFWQNVGQCCGSAGVADYFLSLHKLTGNQEYLDLSTEMTQDVIQHMTADGDGLKWIHAENRTQPDNLQAQTGYMQGASGIGLHFLRLHAFLNDKPVLIRFPDSPF